jgi:hypothetical protein
MQQCGASSRWTSLECPRCGGRMRLLAAIHPPDATQAILDCLDLPSRALPTTAPLPEDAGVGARWETDFEAGVSPTASRR